MQDFPHLPKKIIIPQFESPEDIQMRQEILYEYAGPMTAAEYETLYGVKPIPQSRTTEALHQYGDPVAVPNEPTNIEEGGHLPPDKDFDELD